MFWLTHISRYIAEAVTACESSKSHVKAMLGCYVAVKADDVFHPCTSAPGSFSITNPRR